MPQEEIYLIKKWAKDDRPREKLLKKGTEALSDAELLAILIQNGTHNRNALEIARELLAVGSNNLSELSKLSANDLMKIKGIGEAKAVLISAALELGRRRHASAALQRPIVTESSAVARMLQAKFRDLRHEVFAVVLLNRANKIKQIETISSGGITGTVADPRIILKRALEEDAVNIILCHNHPSGNLKPSRADIELTHKIKEAASYLDIKVLDHIIVSDEGYFSFADEGLM